MFWKKSDEGYLQDLLLGEDWCAGSRRETRNCRVNQYCALMLGDPFSKGSVEFVSPCFFDLVSISSRPLLVIIVAVVCMLF